MTATTLQACRLTSSTVGADRVSSATTSGVQTARLGAIGEFAGAANSQCKTAITGLLQHVKSNSDVWMGAVWWGGGPWWRTYIYGNDPLTGTGYTYYDFDAPPIPPIISCS